MVKNYAAVKEANAKLPILVREADGRVCGVRVPSSVRYEDGSSCLWGSTAHAGHGTAREHCRAVQRVWCAYSEYRVAMLGKITLPY